MEKEGRKRIVIENVRPEINCGRYPIKRVVGEKVVVEADVFGDGHDLVTATLLWRRAGQEEWRQVPMRSLPNDRWQAEFSISGMGDCEYTLQGRVDHFQTWRKDFKARWEAGQNLEVELLIGADHIEAAAARAVDSDAEILRSFATGLRDNKDLDARVAMALDEDLNRLMARHPDDRLAETYQRTLRLAVERPRALFSSWYEFFPRSFGSAPGRHGSFADCQRLLPEIADMGFDVVYLPPVHPIAKTNRKGKNNAPTAGPEDPGSPWAIGSSAGGHKALHPELGTLDDFRRFVAATHELGMEVALDLAYQCSPDHPYVREHPEWFRWRPDGTVQYAENPPKKYQDVLPLNFETEKWRELWQELKSVVLFWIEQGVRIFRVDNPHTKPFPFWEWLIGEVRQEQPEVIFLSEAFARPKIMYGLAKIGFSQSYTYFTWRNTKQEFVNYLTHLTRGEEREHFRPNFWPNTPDILPEHLQYGGRPAFMARLVLAATLSSNYGMYGPAFELCVGDAVPGKEEYLDSEKYEIKSWDRHAAGHLRDLITRVNQIRRANPALQTTWNLEFYETDNDYLLAYGKVTGDLSNIILTVVNLDPFHTQAGFVRIPMEALGIAGEQPYLAHELISGDKYIWHGERNYVELDPRLMPAHIMQLHRRMRREQDFDYFF